jgi:hypothetical protein
MRSRVDSFTTLYRLVAELRRCARVSQTVELNPRAGWQAHPDDGRSRTA